MDRHRWNFDKIVYNCIIVIINPFLCPTAGHKVPLRMRAIWPNSTSIKLAKYGLAGFTNLWSRRYVGFLTISAPDFLMRGRGEMKSSEPMGIFFKVHNFLFNPNSLIINTFFLSLFMKPILGLGSPLRMRMIRNFVYVICNYRVWRV